MLDLLKIRDFALVDELTLTFSPGLTVLTGETGAGKSILVDALQGALGEKVDPAMVRSGAELAVVEAAFSTPGAGEGEDDALVLRREVPREGKGRALIDGALTPLARLRERGDLLCDLAGQHEHQTLLRPAIHLALLDSFGGLTPDREAHSALFRQWRDATARLRDLSLRGKERAARIDYLRFVAGEIEGARIGEGEDQELLAEEKVLAQAERLREATLGAVDSLEQEEGAALGRLSRASTSLRDLSSVDPRLSEVVELLESARAQASEAVFQLSAYADRLSGDPARLEEVASRLALLGSLKKKYGPSLAEVAAAGEKAASELAALTGAEEDAGALAARERELAAQVKASGEELSGKRRKAAARMEKKVMGELAELGMEKTRFAVSLAPQEPGDSGSDAVEFLLSPNPGEPLLPLRKIASGGELSRVMLAVKAVLSAADAVPTLVFDEVDAGLGGQAGRVLGRKLRALSAERQVLCITHLAPVAACAHHHIKVEKVQSGGRTVVRARLLTREERVAELARMLGGAGPGPKMVASARELLEASGG